MVICVRVKNTFYSIICTFASILKLLDLLFPCFLFVTRRSDIDECSSGSHDCHQNATCVNTAGHYDCICKPGLTGSGRNCSGKVLFVTFFRRQSVETSPPTSPPPPSSPLSSSQESLMTRTRDLFFPSGGTHLVTYDGKAKETFIIGVFSSEKVEGEVMFPPKTPRSTVL